MREGVNASIINLQFIHVKLSLDLRIFSVSASASVLFCLLLSGAECSIDLWFVYMLCMKCERVCLVPDPATVLCSAVQCSQCSAGM